MKYFTKQWFQDVQDRPLSMNGLHFEVDKRASKFSEDFFQEKIGDFYGKEHLDFYIDYWKKYLPKEIIDRVADIRILAMNIASQEVCDLIVAYCTRIDEGREQIIRNYKKESEGLTMPEWVDVLANFHDSRIVSVANVGSDLIMKVEPFYTDVSVVTFKNAKIVEQELKILDGAYWSYEEIYKKDGFYEIHVMLSGERSNLREGFDNEYGLAYLTLTTTDVILERLES